MSNWFFRRENVPLVAMTPAECAGICFVVALLAIIPLPFVIYSDIVNHILVYGSYLCYLLALALLIMRYGSRLGIFHPLIFYILWVGVLGLIQGQAILAVTGLESHWAPRTAGADLNAVVATSFLLETIAIGSLFIGYALLPHFRVATLPVRTVRVPALISALWVGIAVLAVLALATIGGGIDQVLMQRGLASDQRIAAEVGSHWAVLASTGVIAPLVWVAHDRRAPFRLVFWLLVLIALSCKFIATGSRGGTIIPLIMIGAIWMLNYRTVPYRAILLGALMAMLLVGALGEFRKATMRAPVLDAVYMELGVSEALRKAADELQYLHGTGNGRLAVLAAVPDRVPYLFGKSYLSIPYVFAPRAIFGEKPPAVGRMNSTLIYGNPLNTIPAGAIGEAYWNFSYPGVVIVFLLFGMLLKYVMTWYYSNTSNPLVMVVLVYVVFYLQPNSDRIYSFIHLFVPAVFIYLSFFLVSVRSGVKGSKAGALRRRSTA